PAGAAAEPAPAARRRRPEEAPKPRRHSGTVVLLAVVLPLAGALVDETTGPGLGTIFALCAVLGTAAAAALATRAGWWWVLTSPPPVVLAGWAGAELLGDSAKYQGSKALATGSVRWLVHGFPVMAAAIGVGLLVVLVRVATQRSAARRRADRPGAAEPVPTGGRRRPAPQTAANQSAEKRTRRG
ncbi:DUF6542 domain-containing protein, partial [Kitasatospora sp. LaBMicrA B282]|uniref:DUF6542 domain-containing protein n=1 Tax=Kitasatospora sp. LaBMicrA B282 TaxID=3420949 RepID=UPI003D13493B